MHVRACASVCVCQVVINKDRNIGFPAALDVPTRDFSTRPNSYTCTHTLTHTHTHTHSGDKDKLIPAKCTAAKLTPPVEKVKLDFN